MIIVFDKRGVSYSKVNSIHSEILISYHYSMKKLALEL